MTERKPPGLSFESWIDKQIREAQERGEFDDLPLTGKPLPSRGPGDELWWVRDKLAREGESADALLPTPLKLRKEVYRLPEALRDVSSEQTVRDVVRDLNARIAEWLRAPSGPQIAVRPVDADAVVEQWRVDRADAARRATAAAGPSATAAGPSADVSRHEERHSHGPRWWRRLFRRSGTR